MMIKFHSSTKISLDEMDEQQIAVTSMNNFGRSQNTVPIASTQVAIKGIVQYSTRDS